MAATRPIQSKRLIVIILIMKHKHLSFLSLVSLVLILFLSACHSKTYDGDSITNYPDIKVIFRKYLKPYQQAPYTFALLTNRDGKKDSVYYKAKEVDWAALEKPFYAANLYQNKLDKHYRIDIMNDTLTAKMTLLLTALDPKEYTSNMSITATTADNSIQTLYAECRDAGIWNTTEYKLLYVVGKSIQIQEISKSPLSGLKHTVTTLRFLN